MLRASAAPSTRGSSRSRWQRLAPARVRGHGPARARRKADLDRARRSPSRPAGAKYRAAAAASVLGGRVGVDEPVVLVRAQRLLATAPRCRRPASSTAWAVAPRRSSRSAASAWVQDAGDDAIVQLGDRCGRRPPPGRPSSTRLLHERGDRGGEPGERRPRRRPPDVARERRPGGRPAHRARRRWRARPTEPTAVEDDEVMDLAPGHLEQRLEGQGVGRDRSPAAPTSCRRLRVAPASRPRRDDLGSRRSRSVTMPSGAPSASTTTTAAPPGGMSEATSATVAVGAQVDGRAAQELAPRDGRGPRALAGAVHRRLSGRRRA